MAIVSHIYDRFNIYITSVFLKKRKRLLIND
nr:MAG TPA: hypothetical protein [Caudoviricetes sp.]